MTRGRITLGVSLAAVTLIADQASKAWILYGLDLPRKGVVSVLPPMLDLVMVWNHGVTFGLFQAGNRVGQLVLAVIALVVVVGLLAWLRRAESLLVAGSIGAIAGGALGNVADRFRFGMGSISSMSIGAGLILSPSSSILAIPRSSLALDCCCWNRCCRRGTACGPSRRKRRKAP